jgi:putative sigma-54 modulation protein
MKIKITGRHISVSEKLKEYSEKRISKIEKYFQQLIDIQLISYVEKLDHVAELLINGDSLQFYAREKAADLFSAVDLLIDKMEKQIVRFKEKIQSKKGVDVQFDNSYDFKSDIGTEALLTQVSNKPINNVEAFLQMKVNKKEFILFKKRTPVLENDFYHENKNYAVIYKSGKIFKLAEIDFENNSSKEFDSNAFIEYTLDVKDESVTNPKINFEKSSGCEIEKFTFDEAIIFFEKLDRKYMPFFNMDTGYFNILSRNGKRLEVFVPVF